ncbi:hypothetical protein ACIQJ4_08890 [Streptomyces filamentosus]|uniref:hypothetical protein n=1 Tax=Streptomyces filamentosus TaxID=67294 RepID=UPI003805EFB2
MSEETITYWAWMVSNGDGAVYAGISEFRIARALLPGAALPVVPEDLGRHHPHLRRREHEQGSASELGREQFRERQAEILREMVDVLPPGPVVPRAAAVGLLLGSCLLVLADGGRGGAVRQVALSPDGRTAAVFEETGLVELWGGGVTRRLAVMSSSVSRGGGRDGQDLDRFVFSRDGKLLAAVVNGDTVQLWDTENRLALGGPCRCRGGA